MKKQTVIRLAMSLAVLAFALGISGPMGSAEALTCHGGGYMNCEYTCAPNEYSCQQGLLYPECGGDYYCCANRLSGCWACCIWY